MRTRLLGTAIYLCAAGACYWLYYATQGEFRPLELKDVLLGFISPLLYLLGACLLWRTRWAAGIALLASSLALPYLFQYAFVMPWSWYGNAWLVQNAPDGYADDAAVSGRRLILAVAFVLCATLVSLLRVCPDRWTIRGRAVGQRTWPALAATLLVMAVWFISSTRGYYVPIHGWDGYDVRVVYAEKRGYSYREKIVAARRDLFLSIADHVRRPFEFRSGASVKWGGIPLKDFEHIWEIGHRPEVRGLCSTHPPPAAWDSDTWYVWFEGCRFSFTDSDTSPLFPEIVEWAREAQQLSTERSRSYSTKDICLGFCYDPWNSIGPPRR